MNVTLVMDMTVLVIMYIKGVGRVRGGGGVVNA